MRLRTFISSIVVVSLLSGCAVFPGARGHGRLHVAGGGGGGAEALVLGVGIGALVAGAIAAPKYKPGHKLARLPEGARKIHYHGKLYRYHNGVYYRYVDNAFRVVQPPLGMLIPALPPSADTLVVNGKVYYVVEGVYYYHANEGYVVVEQPKIQSAVDKTYKPGHFYSELPKKAQPVTINNVQYFTYGGVFFLPQSVDGGVKYLVVTFD
ncbi:DUF6515 family protein [Alteromonas sp. C1M14]|uniref:DUF6515 family protein n=1 Tax=Alteromonas sp. C1M14 TaxID=2841567 RepID=UPI001C09D65E|nr:DUF6515 family protein [Alteromonas sp. C1M14]MBU2977772.1 hypothetical protein [Alteromonas sp. C1M14]